MLNSVELYVVSSVKVKVGTVDTASKASRGVFARVRKRWKKKKINDTTFVHSRTCNCSGLVVVEGENVPQILSVLPPW